MAIDWTGWAKLALFKRADPFLVPTSVYVEGKRLGKLVSLDHVAAGVGSTRIVIDVPNRVIETVAERPDAPSVALPGATSSAAEAGEEPLSDAEIEALQGALRERSRRFS